MHPFLILAIGMVVIMGAIIGLRLNAFLALVGAAIIVSFLAPGEQAVEWDAGAIPSESRLTGRGGTGTPYSSG